MKVLFYRKFTYAVNISTCSILNMMIEKNEVIFIPTYRGMRHKNNTKHFSSAIN